MKRFFFVVLLLGMYQQTFAQAVVDSTQLLNDLKWMSSDNLQGRRVMTAGNEAAQAYIAAVYERYALKKFKWADSTVSYKQLWSNKRGTRELKGANIVGYIEGSEKPQTYMVISAHFDHLGTLNGDSYNGADDNASGTCGLLAMVKYFAEHKPKHSVIFAAFDAEEMGLVGAKMFVEKPPIPLEQIAYNLNMDMISRNVKNEIYTTGMYQYPFLKTFVEQSAVPKPVVLKFGHDTPQDRGSDNWVNASDQGAFNAKNIPFTYFGVEDHPDYHKPTDEFEHIMPSFYYNTVRFILNVALKMDENLDTILLHRLEKVAK
jgi:hypothetical protein